MGVKCRILINQPSEDKHKAGSLLTEVVKYAVNKPTKFQEVTLSLFGIAKAKWTERHIFSFFISFFSKKSSTTYTGLQELIARKVNVIKRGPGETVTLHGKYEHPFEFYLPENLPTTYKDKTGKITYFIKIMFQKASFFSFNKVVTEKFAVCGYVEPTPTLGEEEQHVGPVTFCLQKKFFAPFSMKKPVVKLKGEMANNCLTPGEQIELSFEVSNQTNKSIYSVRAQLYCYTTYSCQKKTKEKRVQVHGCTGATAGVLKRSVGSLTCVIPTLPELFSLQNCQVLVKEYRVRVTVALPPPHCNPFVEIPIVLGELKPFNVNPDFTAKGLPPA